MSFFTYHSLFATLLAISAFNVVNKKVSLGVSVEPNTLGGLLATLCLIHDFESRVEKEVQEGTFAGTLAANDGNSAVVSPALLHLVFPQPVVEFRAITESGQSQELSNIRQLTCSRAHQ